MYSVIGLGNPDSRYALTRHNIGFQVAEKIAANLGISFQKDKDYIFAKGFIHPETVLLVKPMTFMNRSGIAVQKIMRYYGLPLDKLLIILDDLDLPFGAFRFRPKGSDGGNKGLRSII
ncbi:aminoacyl-tRNA hydrolase, partial [candidate division KSB1 bacterium]